MPAEVVPEAARPIYDSLRDPGRYMMPVAPWSLDFGMSVQPLQGAVRLRSWRLPVQTGSPLSVATALRRWLAEAGFTVVLDCAARRCGGFDFRFGTEVLPAPAMFVDLDRYHVLTARRGPSEALSILVSRDAAHVFVQVIEVTPTAGGTPLLTLRDALPRLQSRATTTQPAIPATPDTAPAEAAPPEDLVTRLLRTGHVVLEDLSFANGAATLGPGPYDSLDDLAAFLREKDSRRVLVVGHSDAVGSQTANRRVSRRRAEAVVDYLRQQQGIPARRLGAEGAGYLAPRASNLTDEGRAQNRRVEVILLAE